MSVRDVRIINTCIHDGIYNATCPLKGVWVLLFSKCDYYLAIDLYIINSE